MSQDQLAAKQKSVSVTKRYVNKSKWKNKFKRCADALELVAVGQPVAFVLTHLQFAAVLS